MPSCRIRMKFWKIWELGKIEENIGKIRGK
jgi:hypothetical protein